MKDREASMMADDGPVGYVHEKFLVRRRSIELMLIFISAIP